MVTMKMASTGTVPVVVNQRKDGFWFSYSPDGKYIAMVVADLQNQVVSAARLAAKANPAGGRNEGIAPDALAQSSSALHPATPRWIEIIDTTTFQVLHRLEGVAGIEEYFYWSPKGRYLVTWQPVTAPTATVLNSSGSPSPSPQSSTDSNITTNTENAETNSAQNSSSSSSVSTTSPNLKIWDIMTGKVVMHFKHAQRQGWPIVRWTDDEKIAARWASGHVHLYHWSKASFHQSPEDNFASMYRETIAKQNVWDWSIARSALALFVREASSEPAQVHLFPLNTSLGEEPSPATSEPSTSTDAKKTAQPQSYPAKCK